jgi:hypothetical protein
MCTGRPQLGMVFMILLALCSAAFAQQPTFHDPLADKLTGNWVLTGTIGGKQTTHDVHAEWALNHQYVQLHEISREKDKENQPQYEAMVYIGWYAVTKQYCAVWLDVWGGAAVQSIGYATPSGDSMPFLFKGPEDTFHNTFTYDGATDTWTWQMDNDKDGKLSPFARVKLARAVTK